MLIKVLIQNNIKASSYKEIISIYPQVLVNAKVSQDKKYDYFEDTQIQEQIKLLEEEFSDNGRVLIRTSGTEPLVRVMIEGNDVNYINKKAKELASLIESKLN